MSNFNPQKCLAFSSHSIQFVDTDCSLVYACLSLSFPPPPLPSPSSLSSPHLPPSGYNYAIGLQNRLKTLVPYIFYLWKAIRSNETTRMQKGGFEMYTYIFVNDWRIAWVWHNWLENLINSNFNKVSCSIEYV